MTPFSKNSEFQKMTINILGGGISGLATAINLAKAGINVTVHERYDESGKRFRGDLQGIENWSTEENVLDDLKKANIELNFKHTPFNKVTLTDGKKEFTRESKEPLFYLVKRGPFEDSLDTSLANQAKRLGVTFHYRSTIPQEEAHIIATGPRRESIVAADKGVTFQTSLPNMAIAIFHDDLAYLGYSYLLVADGYGCLCSVVFHDLSHLNRCFEKTQQFAKERFGLDITQETPVGGIGSYIFGFPKQMNHSLLVGEAAGLQDFLWGFGIRTAIASGHLASQAIIDKKNYSTIAQNAFSNYLKATLVNRYLWEKLKIKQKPLIPYMIKVPGDIRKKFRKLYQFTIFHRLLYPFALRYVKKRYPKSVHDEI